MKKIGIALLALFVAAGVVAALKPSDNPELYAMTQRVCPEHWRSNALYDTAAALRGLKVYPGDEAQSTEARYRDACEQVRATARALRR